MYELGREAGLGLRRRQDASSLARVVVRSVGREAGALLIGKFGPAIRARGRAIEKRLAEEETAAAALARGTTSTSYTGSRGASEALLTTTTTSSPWLSDWSSPHFHQPHPFSTRRLVPGLLTVPELLDMWTELSAEVVSEPKARKAISLALVSNR